MLVNIVIIVGAASGVIVFNFILVTWCLFCQRKHGAKVELQTIALQKRSSLLKGKHVKFAASVKDSRKKSALYPIPRGRPPPFVPFPPASAKVRTRRSDRPRAENLFPQKLSTMPVMSTLLDYDPSVCSDDTVSVYSAASAPLEIHDHLLRSSNSILVAPPSGTSKIFSIAAVTNPRDANLMFLQRPRNPLSVTEKELGPKIYSRAVQQRPRKIFDRPWHQQQTLSCKASRYHSDCDQAPNNLSPPGLLVSTPPTTENVGQELSSTPMSSPYSPPSK